MATTVETVDHDCAERVEDLSLDEETSFRKSEFATKTPKTDLAFVFGEKKLFVSSVVIEMCSPVFEQMISGNVKNEHGLMEIEIPGCSVEDFEDFLTCFYPGKKHKLSESSVFLILPLAQKFGVEVVKQMCECQLLYTINLGSTSPDLLSECLSVAYSYNLETVKQHALKIYMAKQKDDFKKICIPLPRDHEAKAAILESCLPEFILTENKYAFANAFVPREHGIDMADFDDARYGQLKLYMKAKYNPPYTTGNNRVTLWGMNLRFEGLWNNEKNDISFKTFRLNFVRGSNLTPDSRARMAVLYRVHSVSKAHKDIFLAQQFTIADQNISEQSKVSPNYATTNHILEQCLLDGMFRMTIHILMNKPDTKKTTK